MLPTRPVALKEFGRKDARLIQLVDGNLPRRRHCRRTHATLLAPHEQKLLQAVNAEPRAHGTPLPGLVLQHRQEILHLEAVERLEVRGCLLLERLPQRPRLLAVKLVADSNHRVDHVQHANKLVKFECGKRLWDEEQRHFALYVLPYRLAAMLQLHLDVPQLLQVRRRALGGRAKPARHAVLRNLALHFGEAPRVPPSEISVASHDVAEAAAEVCEARDHPRRVEHPAQLLKLHLCQWFGRDNSLGKRIAHVAQHYFVCDAVDCGGKVHVQLVHRALSTAKQLVGCKHELILRRIEAHTHLLQSAVKMVLDKFKCFLEFTAHFAHAIELLVCVGGLLASNAEINRLWEIALIKQPTKFLV
eukprot:Opistho-2@35160